MKKLIIGLVLCVPISAFAAGANSDDVTWVLPTQRVDGTVLAATELSTTEIEVTRGTSVLTTATVNVPITSYNYARATPPNYTLCYRARVMDTEGQYSDWSPQVCKTVKARPNPPGQVGVK